MCVVGLSASMRGIHQLVLSALVLVVWLAPACAADDIEAFYRGKAITLLIGFDVGGGYDSIARLFSRYLTKYIPGHPLVVPENKPGAASLVAAAYMNNVAPRDGTYIGIISRSAALQPLLAPETAKFDPRKFAWIGSPTRDTLLCVSWHTSPIKTWKDMQSSPFRVGAGGYGGDTQITAQALKSMLNANIVLISGYLGTGNVDIAMERGEIDGRCGYSWSTLQAEHADWIRDGKINLLIQTALEGLPQLSNVPIMGDLIAPQQKAILRLLVGTQDMAFPFFAPPGIPTPRYIALTKAFDKTMVDPGFLVDAKRMGVDISPLSGGEIERLIDDIYQTPAQLVSQAAAILNADR